jgi:hypothetical protein
MLTNNALISKLGDNIYELNEVGDCRVPRRIIEAVYEGTEVGLKIWVGLLDYFETTYRFLTSRAIDSSTDKAGRKMMTFKIYTRFGCQECHQILLKRRQIP